MRGGSLLIILLNFFCSSIQCLSKVLVFRSLGSAAPGFVQSLKSWNAGVKGGGVVV